MGFSLVSGSGGYSLPAVSRLLKAAASPVEEPGLQGPGLQQWHHVISIAVAPGLIAQQYMLIFPDQGSSLCLLH